MIRQKIIGIMACDPHGVIGIKGITAWNAPHERDYFLRTTENHIAIMNDKTYLANPQDFYEDRYSVVMTSRQDVVNDHKNLRVIDSIESFLNLYPSLPKDKKIFMIGGVDLAIEFFEENLLDEFLLTKFHKAYEGDVFFPLEYLDHWLVSCIRKEKDFSIYRYINNHPSEML